MNKLAELQLDALAESGNISMGAAATALSHLLGHRVAITTPRLSYTTVAKIRELYPIPCVLVRVRYRLGLEGSNMFILSDRDAGVIANMMMGDVNLPLPETLDEMYLSAVSEAMNQMMGSSATAMSEMFGRTIDITPPELEYVHLGNPDNGIEGMQDDADVIQVSFDLTVGDHIASTMLQILPTDFAEKLVTELLSGIGDSNETVVVQTITSDEADTVSEIGNISMGAAATALSNLLDRRVNITTPRVTLTNMREVKEQFPVPCVVVNIQYLTGLAGENVLIIRERDAAQIAAAMMGLEDAAAGTLDEIQLSAVSEAMNQMMGSSATALSEMFSRPIDISPPETECCDLAVTKAIPADADEAPLLQVSFRMEVSDMLDSELIQLIPLDFARAMISELLGTLSGSPEPDVRSEPETAVPDMFFAAEAVPGPAEPVPEDDYILTDDAYPEWEDTSQEREEETVPLELLRDIPVRVSGLLGRRAISLKELMDVEAGSVVELDCSADTGIDILANGKLVARGEVVVHKDRFGVKITEILQPWQR
ncbi:MAG: flagellar motor switch phosphatase FliY [Bacillota bacterium]|nr:flagellar motor switch phosphatase FliY [Bacillota bacterium]MDW7682986.1 flagellar motor switch phosphatase FliY [Bacillota bacterium]